MPPTQHISVTIPWYVPTIVGVSFIIASAIGAYAFYAVRSLDNVLTVTGSAKQAVTADTAKWSLTVTRTVGEEGINQGYARVTKDTEAAMQFLKANGVTDASVTTQPQVMDEMYRGDGYPRQFNIRQTIVVQGKDVALIDSLSKRVSELSAKDIFVTANWIEFYVSNLPELRVQLLANAIRDAKARAEQIAGAGGQSVGALKSASSGVVQVLAPNSIDVSDYGQYDTQSKEKEVMVTARATFFVR
jgi:uncharacterized protein